LPEHGLCGEFLSPRLARVEHIVENNI
jgi:hypothetical protein